VMVLCHKQNVESEQKMASFYILWRIKMQLVS